MAAKIAAKPVKLVLTREQMFTGCGHRSQTHQRLRVGAAQDGRLRSVLHDVRDESSRVNVFVEAAGGVTPMLFDIPNIAVTHSVARLDVPTLDRDARARRSAGDLCAGLRARRARVCLRSRSARRAAAQPRHGRRRVRPAVLVEALAGVLRTRCRSVRLERRTHAPRSMRDGSELVGFGRRDRDLSRACARRPRRA